MLCLLHIIVCCSQKLGHYALNIISDIASFCKGSSISDCQRHIQKPCQSLHKICLSASGRSDHQHVGLLNLDLIHSVCGNSLVMVVNCYRHYFFGTLLTDYIFIQAGLDLVRGRDLLQINCWLGPFFFLFYLMSSGDRILKASKIDHTYIWHIQKIAEIHAIIHLLGHSVKALLHTIVTNMYIIWQLDHLSCLTLGTMTQETEFFIFILILIICMCALICLNSCVTGNFIFHFNKIFRHNTPFPALSLMFSL